MVGSRFDAFSRTLARGHSRRALTRVLSGLAFSGALARFGLIETAAKGKRRQQRRGQTQGKKKPCPPCKKRKKGKCKGICRMGGVCLAGRVRVVSASPAPRRPWTECGVALAPSPRLLLFCVASLFPPPRLHHSHHPLHQEEIVSSSAASSVVTTKYWMPTATSSRSK